MKAFLLQPRCLADNLSAIDRAGLSPIPKAHAGVFAGASRLRRIEGSALGRVIIDRYQDIMVGLGCARQPGKIFLVRDFLQPVDIFSVEGFLNGNMCHRGRRGRAMPVLVTRRAPNHIARSNLDNGFAFALRPPAASGDEQGLSEWVRVPRRAGAGFKGNARAGDPRWIRRYIQHVYAH
jgi:hypothetical protein